MPPESRPALHFTPRSGWMNDPHGLTYHRGKYHLFFQFVPGRTTWGPEQRWGHATSDDLLRWTEGDVALSPGDGDDGAWSGSIAVPDDGPAALFYTTVRGPDTHIGAARIARPVDDTWQTWRKGDVVAQLPEGVDAIALRDPFVLHDGAGWRMVVGAGLADGRGAALTYTSPDLETWAYDGLLASRLPQEAGLWTGEVWECPQLVRLGDRWVLILSAWGEAGPHSEAYAIGDLVAGRFVAESWARLSYGPSSYAGSVFTDADGAPGLIHWLRGVADPARRWVGAHSIPRRLELDDERLVVRPHPVVDAARDSGATTRTGTLELPDPCDLQWTLDRPDATASLTVTGDDDGAVRLDAEGGRLVVRVGDDAWEMPLGGAEVRVVVDGPVAEVFTAAGSLAAPIGAAASRVVAAGGRAALRGHALS